MSDFREGDKVFVFDGSEIAEGVFERYAKDDKVKICYNGDDGSESVFEPECQVFHDPKRKIKKAIQKVIVENEMEPKRMIKKWVNLYTYNGKQLWNIYGTKEIAEENTHNGNEYLIKAQEIEVEE